MLASGLGVYRFVKIGETSREQHQLVRPSLLQSGGEGMDVTENRPLLHCFQAPKEMGSS
jgi:hypothetical protein